MAGQVEQDELHAKCHDCVQTLPRRLTAIAAMSSTAAMLIFDDHEIGTSCVDDGPRHRYRALLSVYTGAQANCFAAFESADQPMKTPTGSRILIYPVRPSNADMRGNVLCLGQYCL